MSSVRARCFQSAAVRNIKKREKHKAHLDDIRPHHLSLPPARLDHALPPRTQKPMPDLLHRTKHLTHLIPLHKTLQQLAHTVYIPFLHLPEPGEERLGGQGVFADEAGDGFGAGERGESDIDEFGRVEVSVVVPALAGRSSALNP
jgi:hypothetical protein